MIVLGVIVIVTIITTSIIIIIIVIIIIIIIIIISSSSSSSSSSSCCCCCLWMVKPCACNALSTHNICVQQVVTKHTSIYVFVGCLCLLSMSLYYFGEGLRARDFAKYVASV